MLRIFNKILTIKELMPTTLPAVLTNGPPEFPVLIAVSVAIGGSLIVAVIFYRKKSAATVAETSSQNQQKAYQPKEESREDVESPSKSEIENESIDGGVNSMFCPNCGLANDIHGKFCKDCGTNLSQ